MKEMVNKIQNLYQRLDKFLIFAVLVVLTLITFMFNFMWAMPKTFTFLLGLVVGKVLFGTNFIDTTLYGEESDEDGIERTSRPKAKKPFTDSGFPKSKYQTNDFGQPIADQEFVSD